jgi:hypothetical protein
MNEYNIDTLIRETLILALTETRSNRTQTSKLLGVSERTVRNWITKYKLKDRFPSKIWPTTREKMGLSNLYDDWY